MEHGRIHGGERGAGGGREKGDREKNRGKLFSNAYYLSMEKELKGGSQEKKGAFEKNFLRFILNDFFNSNTWLILIIYLLKKHEWCNQR